MRSVIARLVVLALVGPFSIAMAIPFLCVRGYELFDAVFEKFIDSLTTWRDGGGRDA